MRRVRPFRDHLPARFAPVFQINKILDVLRNVNVVPNLVIYEATSLVDGFFSLHKHRKYESGRIRCVSK